MDATHHWLCLSKLEYIPICIKEGLWGVHPYFRSVLASASISDRLIIYGVSGRTKSDRAFQHGYGYLIGIFEITSELKATPAKVLWARECPYCVEVHRIGEMNDRIDLDKLSIVLGISPRDIRARLEGDDMIAITQEQFDGLHG